MRENKALDFGLLLLRLVAGTVLLFYGSQKMFGLFDGPGFSKQLQNFQESLSIPPVLGVFAILSEFFGSLGLILGLLSRLAAFGVSVTMFVATYVSLTHSVIGKNVPAQEAVRMVSYPLLIGIIAFFILLVGAGRFSIDRLLSGRRKKW